MKHRLMLKAAAPALLIGALAACGGEARNDANGSANVATVDNEAADSNMSAQMSGPFADAETKMNEAMMAAVGSDAGQTWAKKMIAHHQGAIDMSRIVLDGNPTADVAKMARDTIEKNEKDIGDIRKLVVEGAPDQASAELYRPAMMDMHQKMMAASGADISETYMRKMAEHHRGAVTMSDVALANGVSGTLRQQVQKTRSENDKDQKMVEAMLRGEPMQKAMEQSGAKTPAEAKAELAPADKAKAADKPAAKTTTASKSAPTAGAAPAASASTNASANCLPEHRAAGHC